MANYAVLKKNIKSTIKQNGNQEITGQLLQNTLLEIVNSLTVGKQFVGIADPSTAPLAANKDANVFYIAITPGVYPNFKGVGGATLTLNSGNIGVIYNQFGFWLISQRPISFAQNSIPASSLQDGTIPVITTDFQNASEEDVPAAMLTNSLFVNKVNIYGLFSMRPFANRVASGLDITERKIAVYHPLISLYNDSDIGKVLPFQEIELVLMVYQRKTGKKRNKQAERGTNKKGWCASCEKDWVTLKEVRLGQNLTFQLTEAATDSEYVLIDEKTVLDWIVRNYVVIEGIARNQMSQYDSESLKNYDFGKVWFGKAGFQKSRFFGLAIRARNPLWTGAHNFDSTRANGVNRYLYTAVCAFKAKISPTNGTTGVKNMIGISMLG